VQLLGAAAAVLTQRTLAQSQLIALTLVNSSIHPAVAAAAAVSQDQCGHAEAHPAGAHFHHITLTQFAAAAAAAAAAAVDEDQCGHAEAVTATVITEIDSNPPLLLLLQSLKINVDMLKLIQLGLTFTDAEGNLPVCNGEHTVWQFNFRGFRLAEDVYAQDSIELLKISGIDFAQVGV
jgi:hypothetical protein